MWWEWYVDCICIIIVAAYHNRFPHSSRNPLTYAWCAQRCWSPLGEGWSSWSSFFAVWESALADRWARRSLSPTFIPILRSITRIVFAWSSLVYLCGFGSGEVTCGPVTFGSCEAVLAIYTASILLFSQRDPTTPTRSLISSSSFSSSSFSSWEPQRWPSGTSRKDYHGWSWSSWYSCWGCLKELGFPFRYRRGRPSLLIVLLVYLRLLSRDVRSSSHWRRLGPIGRRVIACLLWLFSPIFCRWPGGLPCKDSVRWRWTVFCCLFGWHGLRSRIRFLPSRGESRKVVWWYRLLSIRVNCSWISCMSNTAHTSSSNWPVFP